jgi:hypothetical protein
VTTQSQHLYARQPRPAAARRPGRTAHTARTARTAPGGEYTGPRACRDGAAGTGVQTSLPWWALVLPAMAFAALLALLTGGAADASSAAPYGAWLARLVMALSDLLHHLL